MHYRYAVVIERGEDNYGVYVPDLPGCVSVSDTIEEAESNIREAIAGHLELMREAGQAIPLPSSVVTSVEVALPAPAHV